jgi:hypothetical protein
MTFDHPFKLRVLRALTDTLKEITPANGYVSDMADFDPGDGVDTARVFRGRAWFGESDSLPMLSILEGVDPADEVAEPPVDTPVSEYDLQLLIQGFVTDDPQNPTDPAYVLLADVRKRLAAEVKRKMVGDPTERDIFGLKAAGSSRNEITGLRFGTGVVRPADDVSSNAWFWLSVTIRVVDHAALPYA